MAKPAAEPAITAEARADYIKQLAAGRAAAAAKKWPPAVAAFEAALVANPGDARALSELGYAAFFAGELDKARSTNQKALAAAIDPTQKAQILFNQGMLEEKHGTPETARARYEASLSLRPNAIVAKRLAALVAKAGACDHAFASVELLCACRIAHDQEEGLLRIGEDALACKEQPVDGATSTLKVLRWGPSVGLGEQQWFLVAQGDAGWRKIADVGSDYEPGAFGIHNEAEVQRIVHRKTGGKDVIVVSWTQSNNDSNMAGLVTESHLEKNATFCVLDAAPRCPLVVPLEETTAVTYLDEASDPESQAQVDELKREQPPTSKTSTATYTLDDTGLVRVTETRGKRTHLAALLKGVNLW